MILFKKKKQNSNSKHHKHPVQITRFNSWCQKSATPSWNVTIRQTVKVTFKGLQSKMWSCQESWRLICAMMAINLLVFGRCWWKNRNFCGNLMFWGESHCWEQHQWSEWESLSHCYWWATLWRLRTWGFRHTGSKHSGFHWARSSYYFLWSCCFNVSSQWRQEFSY